MEIDPHFLMVQHKRNADSPQLCSMGGYIFFTSWVLDKLPGGLLKLPSSPFGVGFFRNNETLQDDKI